MKNLLQAMVAGGVVIASTVTGHATVLRCDGTNGYVMTPNLQGSFTNETVTLEVWFNARAPGVIVDERAPNYSGWYDSQIELVATTNALQGEVRIRVYPSASVVLGRAAYGAWNHAALRYNKATLTLDGFFNGIKSTNSLSVDRAAPWESNASWGVSYGLGLADPTNLGSGAWFRGLLDEFRVWNVARKDAEIQTNYTRRLTGTEAGLVVYYAMEDGAGTTTADGSGHGLAGTLNGGVLWNNAEDAIAPAALTLPPAQVTATNAVLNGWVNTNGVSSAGYFESWSGATTNRTPSVPVAGTNGVLNLGGFGDYAQAPSGIWFSNDFTIEAWVYERSYNNWSRLIDFGSGPSANNVVFALCYGTTGKPLLEVFPSGQYITAPEAIPLNQWVHLAGTLKGTTATLFVNGVAVATGAIGAPAAATRTLNFIGRSNWSADSYANALYEDLRIWNVARTPAQVRQFMTEPVPAGAPGLLLNYRFDSPSGNGSLAGGASILSLNRISTTLSNLVAGTVYGARAVAEATNGVSRGTVESMATPLPGGGTALQFDGVDDSVLLTRPVSNDFTLECWFRTTQTNGAGSQWYNGMGLVDGETSGTTNDFGVSLCRGQVFFGTGGTVDVTIQSGYVADGQWHHAAATREKASGIMQLYVDGQRVASGTNGTSSLTATPYLRLGCLATGLNFFQGQMDEVRVWSQVRTEAQIRQALNEQLTGLEPGLVTYYRMDEGADGILTDATTNANRGLLFHGPAWVPSTAPVGIPLVTTLPATFLAGDRARFNGLANPAGPNNVAWFEWGTNANYGQTTPPTLLDSSVPPLAVNADASGLTLGVLYHYRLAVSNDISVSRGADRTFLISQCASLAESGPGSLRQAIADAVPTTMIFLTNSGVITLTNGQLNINKELTLVGPGAAALAVSGSSNSRVLNIAGGVAVSISGLTLRDGRSANGGASSPGDSGGGIYNAGALTLNDCVVTNNGTGAGGVGSDGGTDAPGAPGGAGGSGGGIYSAPGSTLTLNRCSISGNFSGVGAPGGAGGHGYSDSGFFGGAGHNGGPGGAGGRGGLGGGIYSEGLLALNQCLLQANISGPGGWGGIGGGGGDSGTFYYGRSGGNGGVGGAGGDGGAIYCTRDLLVTNCTLSGNFDGPGGGGGSGGHAGSGGMGSGSTGGPNIGGAGGGGGGLCVASNLFLRSCTVAYNGVGTGGIGGTWPVVVGPGPNGSGGGIACPSGAQPGRLVNSAVAQNTGPGSVADNVFGGFASQGHNLVETTNGSTGFGATGDLLNLGAMLGPLTNNGGSTLTHAPLPGSPLINAGDNTNAPATDQRGFPRVMGAAIDIGALEFQAPPSATTLVATQVISTETNANVTLNGTVTPNGVSTVAWFEWGTSLNYDRATPMTAVGSTSVAVVFSNALSNLAAGIGYHYRLAASNSLGVAFGADQAFGPLLITLRGDNPFNLPRGATFTEPGYDVVQPIPTNINTWVTGSLNATVAGRYVLTYHATNALGAIATATRTVIVFAPPAVTTLPVTGIASTEDSAVARLNGVVNPNGDPATAWFEWGPGTTYGNRLGLGGVGSGSDLLPYSCVLSNLMAGMTYQCRLVATNRAGVSFGAAVRFSTLRLVRNGDPQMTNQCHSPYVEPGATVQAAPLALAAGFAHSLALELDATVLAWGAGTNNSGMNQNFGQAMVPDAASNVVAVAAGAFHSLALRSDGSVVGWGNNSYGQVSVPAYATNLMAVAAGHSHTLALRADGRVLAWGAGTNTTGTNLNFGQALVPANLSNVVAIAAGASHSLALRADGTVVGWGSNTVGQISAPARATNLVGIAAGLSHSLGLTADGTVVAWGDNSAGQTNTPAYATNVVAIAAGARHSLALKADGTMVAWGDNSFGQTNTPPYATNVVLIAAGGSHNLALLADRTVIGWGNNDSGQTSIPTTLRFLDLSINVNQQVPVDVPGVYELIYTVTNNLGVTATVSRTVFIPFAGSIAGFVFDNTQGLPGITVAAMREWQPFPTQVIPLPDVSTNDFPLSVAGTNIVGAVELFVDIIHPFRGDLELTLFHTFERPPGTTNRSQVRLKDSSLDEDFEDLNTTYSSLADSGVVGDLGAFYGEPMNGTWTLRVVDAFPGDEGTLMEWKLHLGVTNVITGSDGGFQFTGLDTIPWYVVQPLWSGYEFVPAAANNVAVGTTNLEFHLLNAPISGTIFSSGKGIAGVTVTASGNLGNRSALSDASGNYLLPALAPGLYHVEPSLEGHSFNPAFADVNARATHVDFTVATYPISGRITNSFGFGVSGIVVSNSIATATTDLDGFYTLLGVPAGTWTVTPLADRTLFAPASTNVTVGPAARDVDFAILSSPPTVTAIADLVIPANTNTGPLRFTVGDGEMPAGFLKVEAISSNATLVPNTTSNLVFDGAGAERVLIITPAADAIGTTTITLTVSDSPTIPGVPILSTSTSFNLRVNARPLAGVGTALALDGVGDAVLVNSNVLPFKGSFSVEAWVQAPTNAAGAPRTFLSQGTGANAFAWGFDAQGRVRLGTNWLTSVQFPWGSWHHFALVRDTTNTQLYLDAQLRTNVGFALPHPPQTADFCIGARSGASSEFWLGSVDEVRVWRRALSAAEIQQNTNRIVLGTESSLAGLWRFDEHYRTNALDSSVARQHGLLVGHPQWVQAGVVFDHYVTPEDNGITDFLPAFDADGDAWSYRIVNTGEKGDALLLLADTNDCVVITNAATGEVVTNSGTGQFTYQPKPNINGLDHFSFLVNDGFQDSDLAVITINILADTNPPSISLITDQITAEEQPLTVSFQVGDVETAASNLVLTAQSDNPAIVPNENIVFGGTGTNRTVTITPATNAFGTNITITLFVSDGQWTSSRDFRLTVTNVNDPPVITGLPANVLLARNSTTNLSFNVGDVDNPVPSLVVGAWAGNGSLVAVIATNGSGPARSVTFRSGPTSGVTTVTLTVSDGSATTTNVFTLTVNDPPTLALPGAGVWKTFANLPGNPILLTIGDTETASDLLRLTATASDPSLISQMSFSGDGANRTLIITPASNQVGSVTITLTLTDGDGNSVTTNFVYTIAPLPPYELIDLTPVTVDGGIAMSINDNNQAVGYSYGGDGYHAFLWETNVLRDLGTMPGSSWSLAYGINARGQVVGISYLPATGYRAFLWATNGWGTNVMSSLGTLGGGWSVAYGINGRGQVVGESDLPNGSDHAFLWPTNRSGTNAMLDLATLGGSYSGAFGINAQGQVVGQSDLENGTSHPFLWGTNGLQDLGSFGGSYSSAGGINDRSQVVGYSSRADGWGRAFLWETNQMTDLGDLGGYESAANAINNDGEAVGYATTAGGTYVAAAFFDGVVFDLNTYLSADSDWLSLTEARAINNLGSIVGYGQLKDGRNHAFLLQLKWTIGEPIPVPAAALDPATGKPYRVPDFTPLDAFVWGEAEGKLYAVKPAFARVRWYDTADIMNGTNLVLPRFTTTAVCVWPDYPQIHVAGVPVQVEVPLTQAGCRFLDLEYSTDNSASVDPGTKVFTASNVAYSVLRYLRDVPAGETPDPSIYSNLFQVVRTVAWSDPDFLVPDSPAVVGQKVTDPATNRPLSARSGFVVQTNAYYDSAIYDPMAQTGPIIPVNANDKLGTQDDLVVAFFHSNRVTGADWPDEPVHFKVSWPTNADKLVIASLEGSGTLDPLEYREMQIYNQPNPALPGFNPNEEHALFAPTTNGQALFALRNDLSAEWGVSSNFVLLKYQPPDTNEWHMKVFEVVAEDAANRFQYAAEAGKEIQPPYPLGTLPLCPNKNTVTQGRAHRDYAGRIYARAADTPGTINPDIVVRYFYPLMPDFYYNTNAEPAVKAGDCIAWLDHRASGALYPPNDTLGIHYTPIDVTYHVTWPTNVPTLHLGETLLTSKRDLPDIKDMASAELVFDTLNPDGIAPTNAAVRMFDPLSARVLRLTNVAGISASYQLPSNVRLQNAAGQEVFTDLPYVLRSRLSLDPLNKTLSFKGILDESGVGEPLLLVNVMSARERDRIKQLSAEPRFQSIIDALYKLTRNPNQVDMSASATKKTDLVPTDALLIGFINKFTFTVTTNTGVQINYFKAGTAEISVSELRRLEAANAVNQSGSGVTVFVRASRQDAPAKFSRVEVTLESFGDAAKALTAGLPIPAGGIRYLTVVENDNAALSGLPVDLKVIALTNTLFKGDVKLIYPDNVFDEKLTLRHSLDFAGAPENAEFEWYYHPDLSSFLPTDLPAVATDGRITDPKGWQLFNVAGKQGVNDITLGDSGQSSLFTLQDNWFVLRYRYTFGGQTNWSDWVGDPASGATPRAMLAEGWIKRVIKGINQFEARVKDFHSAATETYASMLIQAGQRYEGDIAFNSDAGNLNQIGLIETYETVLRRGKSLSIDGVPPVSSDPANNALLLAASRIADLYMLLGNEAFADAADPLVTFTTDSGVYGSLAPSIFCFQNQLDSLLDEELALLRGRDDSGAGVGAKPVYNRLFWNFTTGEGEVAYAQNYNITDQNQDGVIDEYDARILYPQGHGDAWGHYLTAMTTYYGLLRHPRYTWVPRAESIVVAGASISVDFLDERKFAIAAAAKASTGAQLVDLTYRSRYVDDPAGQWQGYKDTDTDRAWGVTEWARRAAQGAYFDWLTANAILPAQDPNTNHTGIQQIDRTTVVELDEVLSQYHEIQSQMDKADAGLNPLGLAKGVVPFDIDPLQVDQQGLTHFEQISARAVKMMNNAILAWNEVNQLNDALRRNQDSVEDFTVNVAGQEQDYKNRLIETFGYPYAGDMGPGQTYPSDYDGPDLYHYMYVDTIELTGESLPPSQSFTAFFTRIQNIDIKRPLAGLSPALSINVGQTFFFPEDVPTDPGDRYAADVLQVNYPVSAADLGFVAPAEWGRRRAPGEIQQALSGLVEQQARLQQAEVNYDNLLKQIDDAIDLLEARYGVQRDKIYVNNKVTAEKATISGVVWGFKQIQEKLKAASNTSKDVTDATVSSMPTSVGLSCDVTAPARGFCKTLALVGRKVLDLAVTGMDFAVQHQEDAKQLVDSQGAEEIETTGFDYETQQQMKALEEMIRQEPVLRAEAFAQREVVGQAVGAYQAAVAKGLRLVDERVAFRKNAAADTQVSRYRDMGFRIFRNDALQKYRAQFDLAARYVYLAATAYDYEVNLLGTANGSGRQFLTDIVRQRSLGQMRDGVPVVGVRGLADPLARLNANFEVLKGQMGFLTPEIETGRFSLRSELFRIRPESTNAVGTVLNPDSQKAWQDALKNCKVVNLWDVPEFRRYCRSFAPESAGPQPGLVIHFPTTVTFGLNFFGWPLSGGDSAYDSSRFATKIRSVGVWFNDYDGAGLSATPRVYLVPVGADVLRAPSANDFTTREWKVVDQAIPEPFPLGPSQFNDPAWIPINDTLGDSMIAIRRFASFRAYHDAGWSADQLASDSRLIGRSVWNTDWVLIIPGGTFLNNADDGLERFISSVSDIKLFFQTYSYPGN